MNNDSNKLMSQTLSQPIEYSWKKVLLWAFMFYLVWNWKSMALVFSQGVLPGPDDFLRLHQVQNWLTGQDWYDLTAYRMSPTIGADIHWSRLVDIPIAAIIVFFEFFTDSVTASRLAAILWPATLFLIAISAMIALCDRLAGKKHRLLALFFFVLSINTMAEFKPGRLDHHNVQIVLLILIMLGLAKGLGRYSNYWVGVLMTLSLVVGLDSIILIIGALGFLALNWAFNQSEARQGLFETGMAIGISSLIFYGISTAPENWLSNNACDAYSAFYVSVLVLLSISFLFLVAISKWSTFEKIDNLASRLIIGVVLAGIIIVPLFYFFPHCLDGPLGNVSPELKLRWLDKVTEAKDLVERIETNPSYWGAQAIYLSIVSFITLWVVFKRLAKSPVLAILGFIVLICILGSFYQTRILRTGIYSIIPFCVIFVSMSWDCLSKKLPNRNVFTYLAQSIICLALTSTFWFVIGLSAGSFKSQKATLATVQTNANNNEVENLLECTSDLAMSELLDIMPSHIISDLNTSTALLVHTPHSVEAGSYHRNGESILNVVSFLEGSLDHSKQIIDQRGVGFVVICQEGSPSISDDAKLTISTAIAMNKLPEWLEWVSNPNASLAVLKVTQ